MVNDYNKDKDDHAKQSLALSQCASSHSRSSSSGSAVAAVAATATTDLLLIDDETGPAPPVAMSDVAAIRTYPIAMKRAGAPGLEIVDDGAEPTFSADSPTEKVISKNKDKIGNESSPPIPFVPPNEMEDKKPSPYADEDSIIYPTREEIEDEVEELANSNQFTSPRRDPRIVARENVEDTPQPDDLDRGRSTVRIPEAWAVTERSSEPVADDEGNEVLFGQPLLPWWEEQQTRLNTWALLCLFSTIALTAHETEDQNMAKGDNIAVTACLGTSLSFSAVASLAYVMSSSTISSRFVGTKLEGAVSFIIAIIWAVVLFYMMDPSNGLGVMWVGYSSGRGEVADYYAVISNFNLFFSSWGGIICALIVLTMFVWEWLGKSGGMGMSYASKWCLLMLTSIVTIIECNRFKNQICAIEGGTTSCVKNTCGLATGYIGLLISSVLAFFSFRGRDTVLITTIAGFAMAMNYTICAGQLTFGMGPATYLSNQSLWAWLGFFISFYLFGTALKEYFRLRGGMRNDMSSAATDAEIGEETTPEAAVAESHPLTHTA